MGRQEWGERVIFWEAVWKDGKQLKITYQVCALACGTHLHRHTQIYICGFSPAGKMHRDIYVCVCAPTHTHIYMHTNVQPGHKCAHRLKHIYAHRYYTHIQQVEVCTEGCAYVCSHPRVHMHIHRSITSVCSYTEEGGGRMQMDR